MKVKDIKNIGSLKLRPVEFVIDPDWLQNEGLDMNACCYWQYNTVTKGQQWVQIELEPIQFSNEVLLDDLQKTLSKYNESEDLVVYVPELDSYFNIEEVEDMNSSLTFFRIKHF